MRFNLKLILADIVTSLMFILFSQQKLQQHMKLHGPTEAGQKKVSVILIM